MIYTIMLILWVSGQGYIAVPIDNTILYANLKECTEAIKPLANNKICVPLVEKPNR